MKANRGIALAGLILIIAGVGVVATWAFKPSLLPGTAAHRAAQSTKASNKVEASTQKVDDNAKKIGGEVSASLTAISEANAVAPPSPSRDFIGMEIDHLMPFLPPPDAKALIEAEQRKNAVLEGRLDEVKTLYEKSQDKAAKLLKERDDAMRERDSAERERRAIDEKLVAAAAAEHARTMQALGIGIVALLIFAAWVYSKIYSIGPATLGKITADIRAGVPAIQAIDTYTAPWLHPKVQKASKLATPSS